MKEKILVVVVTHWPLHVHKKCRKLTGYLFSWLSSVELQIYE